jgi:glycosyltransferase involved in cell wall biosynthesis
VRETVFVVPCFNEAARLREEDFLTGTGHLGLLFVDDGSVDKTADLLERIVARMGGRASLLRLERNCGKGEAVRQGMLAAVAAGATIVGYADADLSTPAEELVRLAEEMSSRTEAVLMGSRIMILGTDIERRPMRHYLGRFFAAGASLALNLKVYDTQCGAKLFRATPTLRAAIAEPFLSRWAFDVELIGRLLLPSTAGAYTSHDFVEAPLKKWRDVAGSKLRPFDAGRAWIDLLRIAWRLRPLRRRSGQ